VLVLSRHPSACCPHDGACPSCLPQRKHAEANSIEERGDYFGDAVNTAARMAGLAKSGQIITTAKSVDALSELLRKSTREIDALPVKGKQEEVRIFEVIWHDSADLTAMADRDMNSTSALCSLSLTYGGRSIKLDADQKAASLGRDSGNNLDRKSRRWRTAT